MLKQHCDVCDMVIGGTESYRSIHFGRGYNSDVNTGYDPLIVCKDCWQKMLTAVGRIDLYRGLDTTPKKPTPVGNVKDILKDVIIERRCKTCKNCEDWSDEAVCKECVNLNKWEAKGTSIDDNFTPGGAQ